MGHLPRGDGLSRGGAQPRGVPPQQRGLQVRDVPQALPAAVHEARRGHGLRGRHHDLQPGPSRGGGLRPHRDRHQARGQLRQPAARRRLLPRGPASRQHRGVRRADRVPGPGDHGQAEPVASPHHARHDLLGGRARHPAAQERASAPLVHKPRRGGSRRAARRPRRGRRRVWHREPLRAGPRELSGQHHRARAPQRHRAARPDHEHGPRPRDARGRARRVSARRQHDRHHLPTSAPTRTPPRSSGTTRASSPSAARPRRRACLAPPPRPSSP